MVETNKENIYNNQFTQDELNNEVQKDIHGYEGLYQVSNLGRVKSLDRIVTRKDGRKQLHRGKLIKSYCNNKGYYIIRLCKGCKMKHMLMHRLVAQAFIPNPDNLPEVNHIDEKPSNNRVTNLEWCTRDYNMNYGTIKERKSKALLGGKSPNAKAVIMFDKQGNKLKEFDSVSNAERYLGKPYIHTHISDCCRGDRKSAYGYIWKYKENN